MVTWRTTHERPSYIKATLFERVWPVTVVDMVDLRPCLRDPRVVSIVIAECLSVNLKLLSLRYLSLSATLA